MLSKGTKQNMFGTVLCVSGLLTTMIGIYVMAGAFDYSVLMGSIVGSITSILNYLLYIATIQLSSECTSTNAPFVKAGMRVLRILLLSTVSYAILSSPALHNISGITALFFANISRSLVLSMHK